MTRVVTSLIVPAIVTGILACGGDTAGPSSNLAIQYYALRLNHHAVTLATVAPYDTLTLVATPQTATGATLTTNDTVVYTSSDTSVQVSATGKIGKIRAHTTADVTTDVQIVATMTVGGTKGVTLSDTAYVTVVRFDSPADVPVVSRFSLQPTDSAIIARNNPTDPFAQSAFGEFDVTVLDASADPQPIPWVEIYYHTSPNNILNYNFGSVSSTAIGHAYIYADAVIYGKAVQDSLRITVGYQTYAEVDITVDTVGGHPVAQGFSPDTMFVGVGAILIWHNRLTGLPNDSIDVEFTGPAPVQPLILPETTYFYDPYFGDGGASRLMTIIPDGGGNIAPFAALPPLVSDDSTGTSVKGRRFTTPGIYTYHSRFITGTGVIDVIPNSKIP